MKIQYLEKLNLITRKRIMQRSFGRDATLFPVVKDRIDKVKKSGDKYILKKYKKRYGDGFQITVSQSEINDAYKNVSREFIKAITQSKENITKVCRYEKDSLSTLKCSVDTGILVWREWRAIEKVGLYIPGGKAIYPSSVLMSGIPALTAGCKEIIICTPPNEKGNIPPETLVTADMIGIKKIYKIGGIEAIAAMAFGTKSVPTVYKVYGAGNSFVTEAKMQVFGIINIDMPAGPSEVCILADESANPKYIAADLLADGEHGYDSGCVLITTSKSIAIETIKEIKKQLINLPTKKRVIASLKIYGLIGIAKSKSNAIDFINEYAPEHLEIMTKNPKNDLKKIINAGSVFLGQWTTKSAGDYATGANHVLPTGGMAKMFSPLSVDSFGRLIQVQKVTSRKALGKIRRTVEYMGEIEKLPAHKQSCVIRFEKTRGGE